MSSGSSSEPPRSVTLSMAGFYIFSGICQPLIMTLCKDAGLADPTAQLYMLFYYLGQSVLVVTLVRQGLAPNEESSRVPLSLSMILRSIFVSAFDIGAQALNYTGASLAGPTIFAVVYSSVTVWTAIFSRILLKRSMVPLQWLAVVVVFAGLSITATDSLNLGPDVIRGTALVFCGSAMHAGTYVMNEFIMTKGSTPLSVNQNAAIQGVTACLSLLIWQLVYTWPRLDALILKPMHAAGTTLYTAAAIFFAFALANLIHSFTFYHTLRHYPGGATSAGVMKGLQAVLVFVAAHWLYCGRVGGNEMCFSLPKLLSLVTVVGGVTLFGVATEQQDRASRHAGYARIESHDDGVEGT